MNDHTKHIIAKEIYFFFKWFVAGIGISIIPLILCFIVATFDTEPDWYEETCDILEGACGLLIILSLLTPIWIYIYRFIKWVKKWK